MKQSIPDRVVSLTLNGLSYIHNGEVYVNPDVKLFTSNRKRNFIMRPAEATITEKKPVPISPVKNKGANPSLTESQNTSHAKLGRLRVSKEKAPIEHKLAGVPPARETQKNRTLSFNGDIKIRFKKIVGAGINSRGEVLPVGDDPVSHAEKFITPGLKLAIVTAGGVQCLSNVDRLSRKDGGNSGDSVIFLIDRSSLMEHFWALISKSFEESGGISTFLTSIPTVFTKNNQLCVELADYPLLRYVELREVWGLKHQLSDESFKECAEIRRLDYKNFHPCRVKEFFRGLFGDKEEKYQWFKALMKDRFIYLNQCWLTSTPCFETIKKICDDYGYTTIAYPSNIEQCVTFFEVNNYQQKVMRARLWENIKILSPALTIKTFQKNSLPKKKNPAPKRVYFSPDTTVYYKNAGKEQSVEQMLAMKPDFQASAYIPIPPVFTLWRLWILYAVMFATSMLYQPVMDRLFESHDDD